MIDPATILVSQVQWRGARRIIRSVYPTIDLYEDIADPADWPLLIAAEQKTNPRLMEALGDLDRVPAERRVAGPGASYLMGPFVHSSPDRPSRFTSGISYGVLYAGRIFETALFETMYHHARFMAMTNEASGWTSQWRELVIDIDASLHDLRGGDLFASVLAPDSYVESQKLAEALWSHHSDGIVYPSRRHAGGECTALFYPDLASNLIQGRHMDYHWDGVRVDLYRDAGSGEIYRLQ